MPYEHPGTGAHYDFTKEKSRPKEWWEYEQEEDEADINKGGKHHKSVSSRWQQHLGSSYQEGNWWSGYTSGKSSEERASALNLRRLEKASQTITRLANAVINANSDDDGKPLKEGEKVITLKWATKEEVADKKAINTPANRDVIVSPNWVLENTDPATDDVACDALGGQVLLGATLKRTMSRSQWAAAISEKHHETADVEAEKKVAKSRARADADLKFMSANTAYEAALMDAGKTGVKCTVPEPVKVKDEDLDLNPYMKSSGKPKPVPLSRFSRNMWSAMEQASAKRKLLQDWPGFAGYMKAHADKTCADKQDVQEFIEKQLASTEKGAKFKAAVAAAQWAVLNQHNPVSVPDEDVKLLVEETVRNLRSAMDTPHRRYTAAKEAMDTIRKRYEVPEEVPGEDDGGTGGIPGMADGAAVGTSTVPSASAGSHVPDDKNMDGDETPQMRPELPPMMECNPVTVVKKENSKDHKTTMTIYDAERSSVRGLIEGISRALRFRSVAPASPLHGLKSGELDEGSLSDLALKEEQPRIWQRDEIQSVHDVAVYILMDLSGSMGSSGRPGPDGKYQPRVVSCRRVCIAFYEALSKLRGVNVGVFGHTTGYGKDGEETVSIREYVSPDHCRPQEIGLAEAMNNNLDGFAIEYVVGRLAKDQPHVRQRYVFVLSDGQPAGSGYSGNDAFEHMLSVTKWARSTHGTHVFGLGLDGAPSKEVGDKMYGKGRFVCLPNVNGAVPVITAFLAQVLAKAA